MTYQQEKLTKVEKQEKKKKWWPWRRRALLWPDPGAQTWATRFHRRSAPLNTVKPLVSTKHQLWRILDQKFRGFSLYDNNIKQSILMQIKLLICNFFILNIIFIFISVCVLLINELRGRGIEQEIKNNTDEWAFCIETTFFNHFFNLL